MAGAAQQRGDELLTEVEVGPFGPRPGRRVAIGLEGLLHRVAEATLKDFLDRLGQAIVLSQTGAADTMRS
jgi:hypothetical protein